MPEHKLAEELLTVAKRDLRAADAMHDTVVFPDEVFGLHAQQAVEKALKAWLSLLDLEYRRIHDLDELFELIAEAGHPISASMRTLAELTPFAVQFRYDLSTLSQGELNRADLVTRITALIDHVEALRSR
jgi:HEPN domain-containing protein